MYRIEAVLLVLAFLPFAMAILVRASVIEPRKQKMDKELKNSQELTIHGMTAEAHRDSAQAICHGLVQMKRELDSLYGMRFFIPAAMLSFLYLIGFSLAHFWEGFTGLAVTVLSILTLFLLMQLTGKVRWGAPAPRPLPAE